MESFVSEFSRFWMPGREADERVELDRRDDEARRQQQALEELAERVTAARSIT